jgi:hypothetical protein
MFTGGAWGMAFGFRKSVRIAPGVRINLSAKSASVRVGPKGLGYTISTTGKKRLSASIPGTGLSYSKGVSSKRQSAPGAPSKDESSAHPQHAAEKAGFEHNIISRRRLTRPRLRRSRRAARRPVVLCKDKGQEINFSGEFEETFPCRRPRLEECHPGFDARDVAEPARQCLKQLLLFPDEPKKI